MTCIICDKKLSKIEEDMNMCILCGVGYCDACETMGYLRYSMVAKGDICDDNCFFPASSECEITDELEKELDELLK